MKVVFNRNHPCRVVTTVVCVITVDRVVTAATYYAWYEVPRKNPRTTLLHTPALDGTRFLVKTLELRSFTLLHSMARGSS